MNMTSFFALLNVERTFTDHDPYGVGMMVVAITVVLGALAVLALLFSLFGPAAEYGRRVKERRLQKEQAAQSNQAESTQKNPLDEELEVVAAISLALYQYHQAGCEDDIISLTIQEVSRRYSPWNSKSIAIMRNQLPQR